MNGAPPSDGTSSANGAAPPHSAPPLDGSANGAPPPHSAPPPHGAPPLDGSANGAPPPYSAPPPHGAPPLGGSSNGAPPPHSAPPLDGAPPTLDDPQPLDGAPPTLDDPQPLDDLPLLDDPQPLDDPPLLDDPPPHGPPPPDVPVMAVPAQSLYHENALVWKKNKGILQRLVRKDGSFSLRKMLVEPTWENIMQGEFEKEYFLRLCEFIEAEAEEELYPLCPPKQHIFRCFNTFPFTSIRVVIMGQKEPYPYGTRAMGLAYSVSNNHKPPKELEHILDEVNKDVGGGFALKPNLESWALQGVLMLNCALTVKHNKRDSHTGRGWEQFIDAVIGKISAEKFNIVFMLWGETALAKIPLIDRAKHLVLDAPSPSKKAFIGCNHFSKANKYLQDNGMDPINWKMG